jgi:exodeoxyribonuclease VII large subunit
MQNPPVAQTYLTVSIKDKDAAKALGARWDGVQRQWYVPEGRELTPFTQWLPAGAGTGSLCASVSKAPSRANLQDDIPTGGTQLALPAKNGVSLSSLLAGVSQAVAQTYGAGVWTLVEVVELRSNGGHVFMGVSERDATGAVLAKTSAVIWQSAANAILPEFERATGAQLAPGIKLLVRARPVFKALHGFSIEIDAIDPQYTLGDLEAKKREIRERLQSEGVYTANKQLHPPWDFNTVLVVAPEGGAGLGDFQAEANRLEQFGVCRFTYVYSRFQGEGAAKDICDALQAAMDTWLCSQGQPPDAVVIIRGGGAVNDLAWLNDYDLARYVCDLNIAVLTGIGHERDNTVLDEVANTRYDTPSKVAAGIEQVISRRTAEAKAYFDGIHNRALQMVQAVKAQTVAMESSVRAEGLRHLSQGRLESSEMMNGIHLDAMQAARSASESSRDTLQGVKAAAVAQLADAKREVPLAWGQITLGTGHAVQSAHALAAVLVDGVLDLTGRGVAHAMTLTESAMDSVGTSSRQNLRESKERSEALIREIAGQGPDKTLKRGFALVRSQDGKPVTRAVHTTTGSALEIEFSDGMVRAITDKHI